MKKIFALVILLGILMVGYISFEPASSYARNLVYYSTCESPKTYRIGTIDERYNMTEEEFLSHLKRSEKIWEEEWEGELFAYDPEGKIEVNLVYDGRSFLSSQINELDSQVRAKQSELNPQIEEYKRKAEEFRSKINQLNSDINRWNSQGGAPPEEYDKLTARQRALQQEGEILKAEADSLNQSTSLYNRQVTELQQTVNSFNRELSFKPEEGEYIYYNGEEIINIYFENSEDELVHTLAHELGHALTIEHNDNPASIMYPQSTETVLLSPDDLEGLEMACAERSVIKENVEKISLIIDRLKLQLAK
jgi:hypothetical protein